jgi:hypothetical protein
MPSVILAVEGFSARVEHCYVQLGLNKVLASGVSRIQNESFLEYSTKSCTLLDVISVTN